ncbi:MAG TPA: aquaporin [Cellulomonadaceae bacterium]|nr:aquaporin [Cellulomonadaceae bacterium]
MANDHPENLPADDAELVEVTATPEVSSDALPYELADLPEDADADLEYDDLDDEVSGPSLAARAGAEALGTFVLVLASVGIAVYTILTTAADLGIALGSGIAVLGAMLAFGHVSGGHFNPGITLGSAIAGRLRWADVLPYWLAQIVGAVAAAAVILVTIPSALPALVASGAASSRQTFFGGAANGYDLHSPLHTLSQGKVTFTLLSALLIEAVLAAVLVAVYLGATQRRADRTVAPVAVGLTFGLLILISLPITNGALNPARATAVALFSGSSALGQLWLFWVAPLVGAAVAALLYRVFSGSAAELDEYDPEGDVEELDVVVTARR